MEQRGLRNVRRDLSNNTGTRTPKSPLPGARNLKSPLLGSGNPKSPLLGLRHAMCSPAPRERENSDDSIDSPRSPVSLNLDKGSGKKSGAFPSIKVEKCDALPPVRQTSASSDTGRKTPASSPEGGHSLYVPSPVHQRRAQDGRVLVVTSNLENMKNFSKSEGDLEEAMGASTVHPYNEGRSKKLDARFRPQKVIRPTVHLTSGHVKEEIKSLDVKSSPNPNRQIRLVPLREGSRTLSDNDLSAK